MDLCRIKNIFLTWHLRCNSIVVFKFGLFHENWGFRGKSAILLCQRWASSTSCSIWCILGSHRTRPNPVLGSFCFDARCDAEASKVSDEVIKNVQNLVELREPDSSWTYMEIINDMETFLEIYSCFCLDRKSSIMSLDRLQWGQNSWIWLLIHWAQRRAEPRGAFKEIQRNSVECTFTCLRFKRCFNTLATKTCRATGCHAVQQYTIFFKRYFAQGRCRATAPAAGMNSTARDSADTAALPLANLGNWYFFFCFFVSVLFFTVALLLWKLWEEPKCHALLKCFLCSALPPVPIFSSFTCHSSFIYCLCVWAWKNKASPKGGIIKTCQQQAALGNSKIWENHSNRAALSKVACSTAPRGSAEREKDGNVHLGLATSPQPQSSQR